jgi:hypothetical protein
VSCVARRFSWSSACLARVGESGNVGLTVRFPAGGWSTSVRCGAKTAGDGAAAVNC